MEEQKNKLDVYYKCMKDYADAVKNVPYKNKRRTLHAKFPELADADLEYILDSFP